jgi:ssDNA-binding Zn-finger/Zn-ribbon topoisomerase 1
MYQILDKLRGSDYYIGMEVNEMILYVGNKDGIQKARCPECGAELVHTSKGGRHFDGDYWDDIVEGCVCPNCHFEEWEELEQENSYSWILKEDV